MRNIIIFIICLLATSTVQSSEYSERIFVATNQRFFLAGETMRIKIYGLDASSHVKQFSKICYVELIDSQSSVVSAKVEMDNGTGDCAIEIPFDTPSGLYELVAYTRWMRNEGQQQFFRQPIGILNSLMTSEKDRIRITDEKKDDYMPLGNIGNLVIKTDKESYSTNRIVHLNVSGIPKGTQLTLSVKREGETDLAQVLPTDIAAHAQQVNDERTNLLPELDGLIIEGESDDEALLPNVTIEGKELLYFPGQPNGNGKYSFYLPVITGEQKIVTGKSKAEKEERPIELISPFVAKRTDLSNDTLVISRNDEASLLQRSLSLQLEHLYQKPVPISNDLKSYYTIQSTLRYNLDDYKRFPTLRETFLEYIPTLTVVKAGDKDQISVFNSKSGSHSMGNSLVLLDGVAIMNHEDLLSFSPYYIKHIDISEGQFVFGNQLYNGIAMFYTAEKKLNMFHLPGNSLETNFHGVCTRRGEWKQNENKELHQPALHQELYWNPSVTDDSDKLSFSTSEMKGTYIITLYGLTSDGKLIHAVKPIKIY